MKHPHYDLIVQWAENPSMYQVEYFNTYNNEWYPTIDPDWLPKTKYRLIPLKKYRAALFAAKSADGYVYYTDTVDDEDKARRVGTDSNFIH